MRAFGPSWTDEREGREWDCKIQSKNKLEPTTATTGYFTVEATQLLVNNTPRPEPVET